MGAVLDIGKGIFGTGSHENTSNQQTQSTQFQGQDTNAIRNAQQGYQSLVDQLTKQAQDYQKQAQGMQVNLTQPQFGTNLDATAQNLVSGAQAGNRAQTDAGVRSIGQRFGSSNPGVSQILQQQTRNAGNLQNNPLQFGAMQEQNSRVAQQAGAQNQAQLQQQQANLGALGSAFGFGQGGVGNAQNLLSTLLGLGQSMGTQVGTGQGQAQGRSGGLFS